MDKTKYELEKLAKRKTGYPVATIAFYGPDDRFASKVAVGILRSEEETEASNLHRWFANEQDVRLDITIIKEILEYIEPFHPRRVAMVDRIIGCPHEEGIDYPTGEKCPQCPFWANRDRWTGEIVR
jgi:hypothetical protein